MQPHRKPRALRDHDQKSQACGARALPAGGEAPGMADGDGEPGGDVGGGDQPTRAQGHRNHVQRSGGDGRREPKQRAALEDQGGGIAAERAGSRLLEEDLHD
jgi:hypothetical protein